MDFETNFSDAGSPESPASIGTEASSAPESFSVPTETAPTADAPAQPVTEPKTADTPQAAHALNLEELEQIAETPIQNEGDGAKRLRERLEAAVKEIRTLQANQQPAQPAVEDSPDTAFDRQLLDGLRGYDLDAGRPSTVGFAQALVQKDPNLAEQAIYDLAKQDIPDRPGYKYAHAILEALAIDPARMKEFQEASATGTHIQSAQYQADENLQYIAPEFHAAYARLSPELKEDFAALSEAAQMQILLSSQREQQVEQYREQQSQAERERAAQQIEQAYRTYETNSLESVISAVESRLANVPLSADAVQDAYLKGALSTAIANFADDSIAGRQSAKFFESLGVQVDKAKVTSLLQTINLHSQIQAKAEYHKQALQAAEAKRAVERASAQLSAYTSGVLAQVTQKLGAAANQSPIVPQATSQTPQKSVLPQFGSGLDASTGLTTSINGQNLSLAQRAANMAREMREANQNQ